MLDIIKIVISITTIIGAISSFYHFDDQSLLLRVIFLLFISLIGILIILTSTPGQIFWNFIIEARIEVRKVIWPSKQETIQTTMLVLVIVLIISLFLWGVDAILGYIMHTIIGTGG